MITPIRRKARSVAASRRRRLAAGEARLVSLWGDGGDVRMAIAADKQAPEC